MALDNQNVRIVFHGTPETNIGWICSQGLDPARRKRQLYGVGDYFSHDILTAITFCQGGHKLLAFAVLVDDSGVTYNKSGVLVLHKTDHQLPAFVLTFTQNECHLARAKINFALNKAMRVLPGTVDDRKREIVGAARQHRLFDLLLQNNCLPPVIPTKETPYLVGMLGSSILPKISPLDVGPLSVASPSPSTVAPSRGSPAAP